MPTDPKTGERLPYAGEPGARADAPPAPEGEGAPKEVIPERDLKPMADEADALMLQDMLGNVEGALGPQETTPADMTEEAMEGDDAVIDTKPVEEMLGVSAERAIQILEAAKMMPQLADKSPVEIAEMLSADMQLRMQVEKLAARASDTAAEDDGMSEGGGSMKQGYGGPGFLGGAFTALTGAAAPSTGKSAEVARNAAKAVLGFK